MKSRAKIARSAVMSVRFEPKNKYLADVAARGKKQSLNRFVELAVEATIKLPNGKYRDEAVWDEDPVRRFQLLAETYPERLSFEEKFMWETILADRTLSTRSGQLHAAEVAARWNQLTQEAEEEKSRMMAEFLSQFKVRRITHEPGSPRDEKE